MNVAVVGLGFMGVTHIRAYQQIPGARIVAVCDAVRLPVNGVLAGVAATSRGPDAIDLANDVKVYRTLEEVLADPRGGAGGPVRAHAVARPAGHRGAEGGQACALRKAAGAHLGAGARDRASAAQAAKGFFMPAMCMRFWPGWAGSRKSVDDGHLRQDPRRPLPPRFRAAGLEPRQLFKGGESGGALLDLHIHDTDFVQFLFGRPASVFSTGVSAVQRRDRPRGHAVQVSRRRGGLCGRQLAAGERVQHVLHGRCSSARRWTSTARAATSAAGDRGRQGPARRQARRRGRLRRRTPPHDRRLSSPASRPPS